MLLLNSNRISFELMENALKAKSTGLITYNFTFGQDLGLRKWPKLRLIMGVSPDDERSIRSTSRIQGFVNLNPAAEVRILPKSHAKLAVFWQGGKYGKVTAVLTSMNGTAPSLFRELGIWLEGRDARRLADYFEERWRESSPINPLDFRSAAKLLGTSEFEATGRP